MQCSLDFKGDPYVSSFLQIERFSRKWERLLFYPHESRLKSKETEPKRGMSASTLIKLKIQTTV